MGQLFDRFSRLARTYWNDAASADTSWAERMLDTDDEELRQIINELQNEFQNEPPTPSVPRDVALAFSVLELSVTANADMVKASYRKLIAQWHPDRYVNASDPERETAQRRAREINAAYIVVKAYHGTR